MTRRRLVRSATSCPCRCAGWPFPHFRFFHVSPPPPLISNVTHHGARAKALCLFIHAKTSLCHSQGETLMHPYTRENVYLSLSNVKLLTHRCYPDPIMFRAVRRDPVQQRGRHHRRPHGPTGHVPRGLRDGAGGMLRTNTGPAMDRYTTVSESACLYEHSP
jgi:hypothetical protein